MAITLDTIINKGFTVVKNGYDNNEVEDFLEEIIDEMSNREAETNQLKEKVAALSRELEQAKAALAARPSDAKPLPVPATPAAAQPASERRSESFELVLSKAQSVYDEITAMAEARADDIVAKAEKEAASIRTNAENQISDLTAKLDTLRKETAAYYDSLQKVMDAQNASMNQLKELL